MSSLSNTAAKRRLVLLCARLLVQGVMGFSSPQTGMDEFALRCVHASDGTSRQSVARNERKPIVQRFASEAGCNRL
jgi:hypothetical protein